MVNRCTICLQEVTPLEGDYYLGNERIFIYHPNAIGVTLWPGTSYDVDACAGFTYDAERLYQQRTVYLADA